MQTPVCWWVLLPLLLPGGGADSSCGGATPAPPPPGTFLYFAYGSNLWAKRLHIKNPSAKIYSIARLKDYRLDFALYADTWRGAVATVVPEPGRAVWGLLWTVNDEDLPHLDRQEGVDINMYYAKNVSVTLPGCRHALTARTYQETNDPPRLKPGADVPFDRQPSATYHNLIIEGAKQSGLPEDYIEFLRHFRNNGQTATRDMLEKLGPPFLGENPNSKKCVICVFVTTDVVPTE